MTGIEVNSDADLPKLREYCPSAGGTRAIFPQLREISVTIEYWSMITICFVIPLIEMETNKFMLFYVSLFTQEIVISRPLARLAWERLQIDTDWLPTITSTADELSSGTNIDDLERPWTPKIGLFIEFFAIFRGVRSDPLGSRSPPYERIKFG